MSDGKILRESYPVCLKEEWKTELFGHVIEDPYRWMTDGTQEKVLEWVRQENEYTDRWFGQNELTEKIRELKLKKGRLFIMESQSGETDMQRP